MSRSVLRSSVMIRTHLASALGSMLDRPPCWFLGVHGGGFASTAANASRMNSFALTFVNSVSSFPSRGFGFSVRLLRLRLALESSLPLPLPLPLRGGPLVGSGSPFWGPLFRLTAVAFLPFLGDFLLFVIALTPKVPR